MPGSPACGIQTDAMTVEVAYRDHGHPAQGIEGYNSGGSYRSWWGWGGYNWQGNAQVAIQADGAGEGGETMPLGQVAVRAQVSVTFDLEP